MRLLTYLLLALTVTSATAVDVPWRDREVWPQSPQARQIAQVMMPSPALLTGACEYSISLYTIEAEGVSIPLSLQYRSNGIRVDDDPQPFGYVWTLTPPVPVIRQIMGRPDEWFPFKAKNLDLMISGVLNNSFIDSQLPEYR